MIRCIAIDDHELSLKIIEKYISKLPFLKLEEAFTNPLEAIPIISKGDIDVIFLDISMPELSGIDFLKILNNPPMVIFTTGYSDFALQGFDVGAVDYLVKPYQFDRFLQAVEKIQQRMVISKNHLGSDYIFIKSDNKMFRINYTDLLFIEGAKESVAVHSSSSGVIYTQQTMSTLLKKLPASDFIRVHRSFIVSLSKIQKIERNNIFLHKRQIPIGDSFREQLHQHINQ